MLLVDLVVEAESKVEGSYVAVKFSEDSQNRIHKFAEKLVGKNLTPKDKLHITVIYSRTPLPKTFKTKPLSEKNPLIVNPSHLSIFPTQSGSKALVLELDSPELIQRHTSLMKKYDLTFDFDEYKPHTTLSYDCGDFEIPTDDKNLFSDLKDLEVIKEYHEPLQLDWAEKNT
jgi:2'-5' RNA ligase